MKVKPAIIMVQFSIKEDEAEDFVRKWEEVANYFKDQPGFIESKLHQAAGDKNHWFNYAVWQTVDDFQMAASKPECRALIEGFPGEGKPALFNIHRQV